MKLLIIAMTLIASINSYACSCIGANFTEADTKNAVDTFIKTKLNIKSKNVLEVNKLHTTGFVRNIVKPLIENSCDFDCEYSNNEYALFFVSYVKDNQICHIQLNVTMNSNLFNDGFKSLVKTVKNTHACY